MEPDGSDAFGINKFQKHIAMKKLLTMIATALVVLAAGCSKEFDDSALNDRIDSLEKRMSALETVMNAYKNNLFIKSVQKTDNGYVITFSDGSTATIANGKDGKDGVDGKNGADGKDGVDGKDGLDGDTLIDYIVIGENKVTFVLTDGRQFSIALYSALSIEFNEADLVVMIPNQTRQIGYSITSLIEDVDIEVLSSADIKAKVVPAENDIKKGYIQITTTDKIDEYSKLVVIVSNGSRIIMHRFNFTDEGLGVYDNTEKLGNSESGEIELEFVSSVNYEVIIPNEAQSWITYDPDTRYAERQSIVLSLAENTGYSREAYVTIQSEASAASVTFHIVQRANKPFVESTERQALIDFYNSMGGKDKWKYYTYNWCTDAPLGEWSGITTDDITGHITSIWINEFDMAGEIPASIGDLQELKTLYLYCADIKKLPEEIGKLKNLEYLTIGAKYNTGNHITGQLPKVLCELVNLKHLDIHHHKITSLPNNFGQLKNLEYLNLSGNSISEPILDMVCELTNLKELNLSSNAISGNIPTTIGNLVNIETLYLGYNKITGSLPAEMGNLTKLKILSIGDNAIKGSIPSWLANMYDLESLDIGSTELSGSLSEWLGSLQNLREVYMDFVKLSGSIPQSLTKLSKLTKMSFYGCGLTGEIPAGFGYLPNLWFLHLTSNKLTGSIPEDLANIEDVWLYDNQLSGKIPESFYKRDDWGNIWGSIIAYNNFDVQNLEIPGPDFRLSRTIDNDQSYNIAHEYANNEYTVIFYWEQYCSYLKDAADLLKEVQSKYAKLGLKIIGMTSLYEAAVGGSLKYVDLYGMTWDTYLSDGIKYPGPFVPTITVIDRNGMVVFTDVIQNRYDLPFFLEQKFSNK